MAFRESSHFLAELNDRESCSFHSRCCTGAFQTHVHQFIGRSKPLAVPRIAGEESSPRRPSWATRRTASQATQFRPSDDDFLHRQDNLRGSTVHHIVRLVIRIVSVPQLHQLLPASLQTSPHLRHLYERMAMCIR